MTVQKKRVTCATLQTLIVMFLGQENFKKVSGGFSYLTVTTALTTLPPCPNTFLYSRERRKAKYLILILILCIVNFSVMKISFLKILSYSHE